MPKYRVEIDQTFFYTVEEVEANSEEDAEQIVLEMIHDMSEDVIQEQNPDVDVCIKCLED